MVKRKKYFSHPVKRQIFDDAPGQTFYMTWDCVVCKCVTEQYHVKYVCVIGQQGQLLVLHSIVFLAGDICHISVSIRSRRQKMKSCSIQFVSTPPLSMNRIWTLDTILKMKHRHSASDLTFSFYPSKSVKCERIIDCSDSMTANELWTNQDKKVQYGLLQAEENSNPCDAL